MGDLLNEINFNEFEEEFKVPQKKPKGSDIIKDHVDGKGNPIKKPEAEPSKPKLKSLMEHTRLRNIAICTRKLPSMPIPELIKAINSLDIQVMCLYSSYSLLIRLLYIWLNNIKIIWILNYNISHQTVNEEAIELLLRMVPNEDEIKAYKSFDAARKDVNELTEEDKVWYP